ncbi:choice-of-anchor P family protein [Actinokineospora auranticolor]|uniref:LPXTG-motif cell wall-anchored protein n=1 Tax=Actinokineospora auranticolor TaxID=155976 RepID=A0A2S6GUQ4_9PSEU|nr:choice-of-anchor P family protein [Actinokineospora auranticolor]PPK68926.1 hypothetical protein CLV40_104170 [Actinokineospora auranticolor]
MLDLSDRPKRALAVAAATACVLLAGATPASAAPGDASAYVADAGVKLASASVVDLGPLAPSGTAGAPTARLARLALPGVAGADLVTSSASRDDDTGVVRAGADLANVTLPLAQLGRIGAIDVDCEATQAGITGRTALTDVRLAGVKVPLDPPPNTVVSVPTGPSPLVSLTFNEQTRSRDGALTVNGVHLRLNAAVGEGDVVLGSATCGAAAAPVPLASGVGLWLGAGLLAMVAVPVAAVVVRRRRAVAA